MRRSTRTDMYRTDGFGMAGFEDTGMDVEMTEKERGKMEGWWYQVKEIGEDPRRGIVDDDSDEEGESAPWAQDEDLAFTRFTQRRKDEQVPLTQGGPQGLSWGEDLDSDEERLRQIEERMGDRDRQKLAKTKPEMTMPIWFVDKELAAAAEAHVLTKDMVFYVPFLVMFIFYFLYGRQIEAAFYVALGYDNLLTGNEIPNTMVYDDKLASAGFPIVAANSGPWWDKSFHDIAKADDWFNWFENVVVFYLFYPRDTPQCPTCPSYRSSPSSQPLVPLGTGSNILVGSLRVRTWRMPPESCAAETDFFTDPAPDTLLLDTRNNVLCKGPPDTDYGPYGGMPASETTCKLVCQNYAGCHAAAWVQWPAPFATRTHCRLWSTSCEPVTKGWALPYVGEPATVTFWSKVRHGLTSPICYDKFVAGGAAKADFGPRQDPQRWKYQSCSGLKRAIYGRIDEWPCGGYQVEFPFKLSYNDALAKAFSLRGENESLTHLWGYQGANGGIIDNRATRFVVVEFMSYQPALRSVFSSIKFYVEVAPGGTWFSNSRFRNFEVWSQDLISNTIFDVFFMLFVFYFFGKLILDWRRSYKGNVAKGGGRCFAGVSFILEFWNLLDLLNLLCFFVVFGFKTAWVMESSATSFRLPGQGYSDDLDLIENLYFAQVYANSLNTILTFLKFLKYVRLNQRFAVLGRTMELAAQNIFGIILIFFVVVMAYSVTANILFGNGIDDYRDISTSFQANLRLLLGDFDYDSLREENRFVAFIFFWSFVVLGLFLLLNFIIAVLSDAFGNASSERPAPDVFEQISRVLEDVKHRVLNPCEGLRATWNNEVLLKSSIIRFHVHWWLLKLALEDGIILKRHFRAHIRELQYDLGLVAEVGQGLVEAKELDDAASTMACERKMSASLELAMVWQQNDSDSSDEEEDMTQLEEGKFEENPVGYIEACVHETGPDAKVAPDQKARYEQFAFRDLKQIFVESGWLFTHRPEPPKHSEWYQFFVDNRMPYDRDEWVRFTWRDEMVLRNSWWDVILLWELHKGEEEEVDDRADLEEAAGKAGQVFLGITDESDAKEGTRARELDALRREMEDPDLGDFEMVGDQDSRATEDDKKGDGEENLSSLLRPRSMKTIERITDRIDEIELNMYKAVRAVALLDKEVTGVYKALLTPGVGEAAEIRPMIPSVSTPPVLTPSAASPRGRAAVPAVEPQPAEEGPDTPADADDSTDRMT
eukprot:TRINITY_DN23349_c0_g1_i1.p1 TRINITY_DN23349_c0_g1~~TRINITY_DN23349_c0_g1_i1.p1  ORF type:complete len:1218 (+),score=384.97 TRINITY_DN23349_c0_g1_i1:71-3724(+)